MKIQRPTLLALATAGTALLASCYPLPDEPPQTQAQTTEQPSVTSQEQQKIREARDLMREQQERERQQAQQTAPRETPPPPREPTRRNDYPFATPVPGKEGFVFSPYSDNKIVDARGIPSGTLVQDPTFPTEKKYFRVP